jgi:hypothetical protein
MIVKFNLALTRFLSEKNKRKEGGGGGTKYKVTARSLKSPTIIVPRKLRVNIFLRSLHANRREEGLRKPQSSGLLSVVYNLSWLEWH